MTFTFAVVGRNEADLLTAAVEQALDAAHSDDEVVYVDGASSDGSRTVAASLGVRVIEAAAGKGRAVATALREARGDYVVLVDADIERTDGNFPLALRETAASCGADLVVGEFDWPERPMLNTRFVYRPLVAALFPEALERVGSVPLSGFRALRTDCAWGRLPPGFGVEAHLNVTAVTRGASIAVAELGGYRGPVRANPTLAREVGAAILDLAVELGRLPAGLRPLWDDWLERAVAAIAVAWGAPRAAAGVTSGRSGSVLPSPPDGRSRAR